MVVVVVADVVVVDVVTNVIGVVDVVDVAFMFNACRKNGFLLIRTFPNIS